MSEVIISAVFIMLILVFSRLLGDLIKHYFELPFRSVAVFGFLFLLAITYIPHIIIVFLNLDTSISHYMYLLLLVFVLILWLYKIRRVSISKTFLLVIVIVVALLLTSTFFGVGEKMGDSIFYFNMVGKNLDGLINKSIGYNGLVNSVSNTGVQYAFNNYYHLFAAITWLAQSLFNNINHSVILNWGSNLLFFWFITTTIINTLEYFKVKNWLTWLSAIVFGIGYWATIYYNITLAHIGVVFLSVPIMAIMLLAKYYFDSNDKKIIPLISILIISLFSFSSTGFFLGSMLCMALLFNGLYLKDKYLYTQLVFYTFPVLLFIALYYQKSSIIGVSCFIGFMLLIIFRKVIEKLLNIIMTNNKVVCYILLSIVFVAMTGYGIYRSGGIGYISTFWAKMSHIDRVQDYYLFEEPFQSLANIIWYGFLVLVLCLNKYKNIRFIFIVLIVCFINPFVIVFVKDFLTSIVYYRVNYLLFSPFICTLGIIALDSLSKSTVIKSVLVCMSSILMYNNLSHYFHFGYIPGKDFNPLYKLSNDEIDMGKKIYDINVIEAIENAKVVSQIYGITMLAPSVYSMFSIVERREQGSMFENNDTLSELYKIFYSPAFAGDDYLRDEANYQDACKLLVEEKVDFIIVRKDLTYLNEYNDYVPLSWSIRGCAENVYQNDGYELFRFYWE